MSATNEGVLDPLVADWITNNPQLNSEDRLMQIDEVTRRGTKLELMLKRTA